MIGVAFQYRHHEDNALERLESEDRSNLYVLLGLQHSVIAIYRGRARTATSLGWPWVDYPHRILDDRPSSPGARPFLENRIAFCRVLQAGDKALLSLLTIRG